jgi:hypothetical protein
LHEAIGELARQMLTPNARAAVIKILGNDDLAEVSTWADMPNPGFIYQRES